MLGPGSTAIKRPMRFFFVLFSGILFNVKWKHGQMSFFSLKTDQNCLGLSKIMLANGADNPAVHSFQRLRTFLVNFQNVW